LQREADRHCRIKIWLLIQHQVESTQLPIEDLYIDLPLLLTYDPRPESSVVTTAEVEQVSRQLRDSFTSAVFFDRSPISQLLQQTEPLACQISTQLKPGARLVIVGDPNCGKTTLLSFLAYSYASRRLKLSENHAALPDHPWIPVTLTCRDLLDANFNGSSIDLIEYQLKKRGYSTSDTRILTTEIEQKMSAGQVLLLVDGLDEIPSARKRQQFAELIANIHAPISIVLTSRVVGFSTIAEPLNSFQQLNVDTLGTKEKKLFVQGWAKCVGDTSLVNTLASFVCNDRKVASLCENVFLLVLIAQIIAQGGILSSDRRADVYRRTIDLMIKRRPVLDDRYESKPHNEILPHLEHLAYHMRLDGSQHWRDSQVIASIAAFYRNEATTAQIQRHTPAEWLNLVLNQIGLLTIAGSSVIDEQGMKCDPVQFFHQSFQEYFAAQALLNGRGIADRTKVLDRLRQLVHEVEIVDNKIASLGAGTKTEPVTAGNWQEVIRFYIGSLHRRKDQQPAGNDVTADDAMLMLIPAPDAPSRAARAQSIFALQTLVEEPDLRDETVDAVLDTAIDHLNRFDGVNTTQNTLMDEVLYSLMRSCFAERCRKRLLQSFIQSRGDRRSKIGSVYSMATTNGEVLTADNAVEILEPLLARLNDRNSIEDRADATLKLVDVFYRPQGLNSSTSINFLADALLQKTVHVLLETAKDRNENDTVSFTALWALGWLTTAKTSHSYTSYRFTEVELDDLRYIVADDRRDAYSRMWAATILSICGTGTPVFNQADDWIMQWAVVADGRKPHKELPVVTALDRPQDIKMLKSLIASDIPAYPKRWVAIAMGRLGCFVPEMIEPLFQIFQDDLLLDTGRDEALAYLALMGGEQVISSLTQIINGSINGEGDE
jgi:hypothetical protein